MDHILDFGNLADLDTRVLQADLVVFGNKNGGEAQFFSFQNALVHPLHGTNFPCKAHFRGKTDALFN